MKKSIVALGIVLALSGCAAAADETLAAEPAALVEISPATEETAQPVEAAATAEPAQTATPAPTPEPTQAPTPAPTAEPTAVPTAEPTQAPVEETVAVTPAQVSMSYGAVPFDLAAGTEQWWSIDSSDSAYWAVQENINAIRAAAGLLAAVLLLSFLPVSARADGSSTLTYRGREQGFDVNPGSAWTAADLFDGLKDVMPGDVRACDIAFENAAKDCDFAVLTLTAEPHGAENPLSESVAAAGETVESAKDFLNQMTLTVTSGGQTLYDGPAGSDAMFGAGVALGTVRVMRTTAMMGEVVGMAASICSKRGALPHDVYDTRFEELRELMRRGAGRTDVPYLQVYTLIDTTAARSEEC